ncbi:efflux transporter outer membrane subunit [Chitinibacter fontanus]|uniref:Efflux transporter outer membrane subunit n=1 Tax=Chitinibacter fontanus TaxID=1737446 RepID=A0A7D5ZEP9_9NEIS|nr:efflux transporter outer membrane subunit [Chitinibacter fontanus]QLI80367.1 efflux transporter outer membrane subunit [Chitinibacter fontanus]
MTRSLISIAILAILSGCTSLAPQYERPASVVQAEINNGYAPVANANQELQPYTQWEQLFTEPALQNLIRTALANNRDYRVAALNIEKVRAQYQINQASRWPTIGLNAGSNVQGKTSGNSNINRQYSATVGLTSYEIDLFGRIKSLNDAAMAQYLGSQAAQQSLRLSLIAEVANAYYNLAADQANFKRVSATLASREQSHALIERRFAAGIIGELDVQQSKIALETARSDRARYQALIVQDQNALRVLLGSELPVTDLPTDFALATANPVLPSQLKSEVLLRRPDVQQAELALQAANANIGAARAAFFPSITLTANTGFASNSLSNLFQSGSGMWLFAPQLNLPIFDGGRNQANLDIANAERDIALANYDKAIQTAFREVSDGLTQASSDQDRVKAQQAQVAAAQRAFDIAQARYQKGVAAYLEVLESQRSLYLAEQTFNTLKLQQAQNLVNVYKATALY